MRRPERLKRAAIALALGLIGPALAHAADAPAKSCDVVVQTRNGGLLDILPAPRPPAGPGGASQIVWRPPSSGPALELWVVYPPGTLVRLGEPSGLIVGFQTQPNLPTDGVMLIVKTQNGRSWRFTGKMIEFGKDGEARVKFDQDFAYGRGLLGAIADSQSLSMSVEQDNQVIASQSFVLTNIDARDRLLAQARAEVEGTQPGSCLK
jgi:hypothetical protein